MITDTAISRGPGRPRSFDMNDALDQALQVFATRGYHGASVGDLSAAMGLAAGSVYKAFKDKRAIFLAAFDRYLVVRRLKLDAVIAAADTGRGKLAKALEFYAASSCGPVGRQGCLVVSSASELALHDDQAASRVAEALAENERRLADLIEQGRSDGSIAADIDVATTARLLLCLMTGMRIVGKTGRQPADMAAVAAAAMTMIA